VTPDRKIIEIERPLRLHLGYALSQYNEVQYWHIWTDRNDAYWVLDLPGQTPADNYTVPTASSVIVKAGYLLRTARVSVVDCTGDLNATTSIGVIGGARRMLRAFLQWQKVQSSQDKYGVVTASVIYSCQV
jgi:hypothetical protein